MSCSCMVLYGAEMGRITAGLFQCAEIVGGKRSNHDLQRIDKRSFRKGLWEIQSSWNEVEGMVGLCWNGADRGCLNSTHRAIWE